VQRAELDARLAVLIAAESSFKSTRALAPLPILGVPGWWPENERADFYADASVFRAPRPTAIPG